jgi:hypothetical protein
MSMFDVHDDTVEQLPKAWPVDQPSLRLHVAVQIRTHVGMFGYGAIESSFALIELIEVLITDKRDQ